MTFVERDPKAPFSIAFPHWRVGEGRYFFPFFNSFSTLTCRGGRYFFPFFNSFSTLTCRGGRYFFPFFNSFSTLTCRGGRYFFPFFNSFSTLTCRGGRYFFRWLAPLTLDPYLLSHVISKKVSLVWLDLGLKPDLPNQWRKLLPLCEYIYINPYER